MTSHCPEFECECQAAAFNRNILHRLNRDLGADFDPASFQHRALWNRGASRSEMPW